MVPQTKVFVGSLPPGSKPQDLRRLFERYGVVTECDIMNRCGFVHMQTEEMASNAIKALDNSSFNGAVITVERGRIKERNPRGGPGGGGGGRSMGNGAGGLGGRGPPMSRPPMRNGGMGGGGMRNDMGPRGRLYYPYNDGLDILTSAISPVPAPLSYYKEPPKYQGMGGPRGGGGMDGGSRGPPRGPGGPMRSSMAGGGGGMARSAPYMREDRRPAGGAGGYDRSLDRPPLGRDLIYPDDGRYAEDRRGFALVDDHRVASGGYEEDYGLYTEDHGAPAPIYDDMLMDRRGGMAARAPPVGVAGGYDRPPQGAPPMGNGASMFTRRPSPMRSAPVGGAGGGYDRGDHSGNGSYNQRFPPTGRVGSAAGGGRAPR